MKMRGTLWRLLFWAFLPLFLQLTLAICPWAQEIEGNIAGEVRLIDGGFPPGQLRVTLEAHGAVADVAYCDGEGHFSFNHLPSNAYTIVIESDGFRPVRQGVIVNPTVMQTTLVHIILRPADTRVRAFPQGEDQDVVSVADLTAKYPPEVKADFEAGQKEEAKGDDAAAISHYEAALKAAPDFYQAHNNLGGLYVKKGKLKEAEKELRRALELNPNSAQAEFNLGNVLYLTGRDDEAKKALQEGLTHRPASAMGRYFLGCVLTRLRDFGPAEEQLRSAQQLDPRMPQVDIALASLYLQTRRQKDALRMFRKFLQKFPDDPLAPKVRNAVQKLSETQTESPSHQ